MVKYTLNEPGGLHPWSKRRYFMLTLNGDYFIYVIKSNEMRDKTRAHLVVLAKRHGLSLLLSEMALHLTRR
jgi:hypothetical protein